MRLFLKLAHKLYGRQQVGLVLGPLLFVLILSLPQPEGLSLEAQRALAVAALMATWWITEAVHIAAAALVPLALFPLMGILDMKTTASRYSDPNIFLFMGGFMIAMAMQKWNLHKRLALYVIAFVGGGPRRLIAGFMLATAFLSMWVSNTATTVMMLPVAIAVVVEVQARLAAAHIKGFGLALMLGIAYAASVGGVATLIGTPPNVIFAGQAKTLFPEMGEVGFVPWFLFAFPMAMVFLLIVWLYLVFVVGRLPKYVEQKSDLISKEIKKLGRFSLGEKGVLVVFLLTALAWLTRADLTLGQVTLSGWMTLFNLEGVHDGTVAMVAALVLFITPVNLKRREFLLDWDWAKRLPWHILILFGGGFALAESVKATGLSTWMGSGLTVLEGIPIFLVVLCICLSVTFLTEITSNTATATMLIPILAAAAVTLDIHPYLLMIPATVSASFAFMLPVATPPNAIVFGSGQVTIPKMAKAGFALNILGAFWITFWVMLAAPHVFNV